MPHRFTALILALLMGGPMCWCGWLHAAETTHTESCCEAKAGHHQSSPEKDEECPCLEMLKARDLHQANVSAPTPHLYGLNLPPLAVIEFGVPFLDELSAALVLRNHGPPREWRPLYQVDCALLI